MPLLLRGLYSATALFLSLGMLSADPIDPPLTEALEGLRNEYHLPALAAAVVRGTTVLESGAVGVRRLGGKELVTVDDQWHIGSCTKSMTATLAAILVERGEIKWQQTVGQSFPELRDSMDPQWMAVTLEQLLAHRGGAPAEPPANLWRIAWQMQGTPTEQREAFVKGLLLRRPEVPPGTKFLYSNQGYSIAGLMLERATGKAWESLLQTYVFSACLMNTAGFGAAGTPGKADQPWGHREEKGKLIPVPPGKQADNPPSIGPAGTVHCSIVELARYAAWHAIGEKKGTPTLKRDSFVKLHTPVGEGEYALGWLVEPREWAGGNTLSHAGSNTMNYAVIWIAPEKNIAFVAATNCENEEAEKACDKAVELLLRRHLK